MRCGATASTGPRLLRRREALAAAALLPLAGCAALGAADSIADTRSGEALTPPQVLQRLRTSRWVLLGELHDNPLHHERRAALLRALGGVPVVAEQLPRGAAVVWGADLRASLVAAGFEPEAWGWSLHRPLFEAVRAGGGPLTGGNAPRDLVRRVAREGRAGAPPDLQALLERAPLAEAARAALDDDLRQGHCGQLPAARVEPMRWAQRVRDLSMWLALQEAGRGGGPVVLLAGNGHVRRDYGVPQLAAALAPGDAVLSVVFAEHGTDAGPADLVWRTAPARRDNPCLGFAPPKA